MTRGVGVDWRRDNGRENEERHIKAKSVVRERWCCN